jgi:Bacterial PH domain
VPSPFHAQFVPVRRSRRGLSRRFASVAFLAAVLPVAAFAFLRLVYPSDEGIEVVTTLVWVGAWLAVVPLAAAISAVLSSRFQDGHCTVEAEDGELRLTSPAFDHRIYPRGSMRNVMALANMRHGVAIEVARGDTLELELPTAAAEEELIAALGFGANDRRLVVDLGGPRAPLQLGCVSVVASGALTLFSACIVGSLPGSNAVSNHIDSLMPLLFVAVSLFIVGIFRKGRVTVGADGILVERPFRKRFIPADAIRKAETQQDRLALTLDERGKMSVLALPTDREAGPGLLAARIQTLLEGRSGATVIASALVARGGRTLAEWKEQLKKLIAGTAGYRAETAPVDVLLRTAESSALPAEQRLGAAMAIGLSDDAQAKERVRVAVEGIANEKLRVAMGEALDGKLDEASVEAALGDAKGSS